MTSLDPRSWRPTASWRSALKYEVASIHLSSHYEHVAFVGSGTDAELAGGSWKMVSKNGKGSRLSSTTRIRGDMRWVGLSKVPGADHMLAMTASGYLYLVENCFAGKFDSKAPTDGGGAEGEEDEEDEGPEGKRALFDEDADI